MVCVHVYVLYITLYVCMCNICIYVCIDIDTTKSNIDQFYSPALFFSVKGTKWEERACARGWAFNWLPPFTGFSLARAHRVTANGAKVLSVTRPLSAFFWPASGCSVGGRLLPSGHVIWDLTFAERKPRMRVGQSPRFLYIEIITTTHGLQLLEGLEFFFNCIHSWKVRATQRFYFLFIFPYCATLA